jgi:putative salt-induced outer membrane protein
MEAAPRLPAGVRSMIDAAIAGGDAKAIEIVLQLARQTHAYAGTEIDEIASQWRLRIADADPQKRQQQIAPSTASGILHKWKGQLELGASRSTGRNSYLGILSSVGVEREGPRWRHKLDARIELQNGRNVADVERIVASWQPNYRFAEGLYGYGLAQFERDPLQGFDGRYTAGFGFGYTSLASDAAKLDLESGPAVRLVDRVTGASASSIAARASLNLKWVIAPTLELKQTGAFYLEEQDRNASAITALDAQLIGPLKARFSYDVRYEARADRSTLDTLSRATLVYRF